MSGEADPLRPKYPTYNSSYFRLFTVNTLAFFGSVTSAVVFRDDKRLLGVFLGAATVTGYNVFDVLKGFWSNKKIAQTPILAETTTKTEYVQQKEKINKAALSELLEHLKPIAACLQHQLSSTISSSAMNPREFDDIDAGPVWDELRKTVFILEQAKNNLPQESYQKLLEGVIAPLNRSNDERGKNLTLLPSNSQRVLVEKKFPEQLNGTWEKLNEALVKSRQIDMAQRETAKQLESEKSKALSELAQLQQTPSIDPDTLRAQLENIANTLQTTLDAFVERMNFRELYAGVCLLERNDLFQEWPNLPTQCQPAWKACKVQVKNAFLLITSLVPDQTPDGPSSTDPKHEARTPPSTDLRPISNAPSNSSSTMASPSTKILMDLQRGTNSLINQTNQLSRDVDKTAKTLNFEQGDKQS